MATLKELSTVNAKITAEKNDSGSVDGISR